MSIKLRYILREFAKSVIMSREIFRVAAYRLALENFGYHQESMVPEHEPGLPLPSNAMRTLSC